MLSSQDARSSAQSPQAGRDASASWVQVSSTCRAMGDQRGRGPGIRSQDGQQEVPELPEEQAFQWDLEEILPAHDLP